MNIVLIIFWCIIGYLIGSLSWGYWIGKIFFHKDIRQYGSHNAGGTNAGRVLGKPIGIIVILLDAFKAFILMAICNNYYQEAVIYAGIAVTIGHCFPCFSQFKGGKGVACAFGYLLGLSVFAHEDLIFTLIYPLLIFILILALSRMVSLSSMTALLSATIISFITAKDNASYCILLLTILIIYRHQANIQRIIQKKEPKVSFLK